MLLNVLRKIARDGESEQQLIVGQRSMGKYLPRRVALGVKYSEELSAHFMPLQFREEQYNVNTLDAFWRNCGELLTPNGAKTTAGARWRVASTRRSRALPGERAPRPQERLWEPALRLPDGRCSSSTTLTLSSMP